MEIVILIRLDGGYEIIGYFYLIGFCGIVVYGCREKDDYCFLLLNVLG